MKLTLKKISIIGLVVGVLIDAAISILIPGSNIILETIISVAMAVVAGMTIRKKAMSSMA